MFTLMARSDPAKKGASGISAFIVPADTKGITIGKPEKKMGQQGAHICDVIFENARVPAYLRLGAEGEGFQSRDAGSRPRAGCTSPASASVSPNG